MDPRETSQPCRPRRRPGPVASDGAYACSRCGRATARSGRARSADRTGAQLAGDARTRVAQPVEALRQQTAPLVSGSGESALNLRAINDGLTDIATDVEGADRAPTDGQQEAYAEYQANLQRALKLWRDTTATSLAALNAHLRAAGMKPIRMTAPKLPPPSEPEED